MILYVSEGHIQLNMTKECLGLITAWLLQQTARTGAHQRHDGMQTLGSPAPAPGHLGTTI